jgi:hypothetical protein
MAAPQKSQYRLRQEELQLDDANLPPHFQALLDWQRLWFMQESFPDKEALLQAVVRGPGPAEDFARYFLALRENRATRVPFAQFCDDVRNKGKDPNGRQRHYWRALVGRLWDHYISAARELSHHILPDSHRLLWFLSSHLSPLSTSIEQKSSHPVISTSSMFLSISIE